MAYMCGKDTNLFFSLRPGGLFLFISLTYKETNQRTNQDSFFSFRSGREAYLVHFFYVEKQVFFYFFYVLLEC